MHEIDRSSYTEPQLAALAAADKLPGFLDPAQLGPELFEGTAWQPVHNMTVLQLDGSPRTADAHLFVLTGIRTREGNATHPDVVSTPTRRLSAAQATELVGDKAAHLSTVPTFQLGAVDPAAPQVIATFAPNLEPLWSGRGLPEQAVALLRAKLGFDRLEETDRKLWGGLGKVSLSKVVAGFSYVGDNPAGEALYEPIVMFGSVLSSGVVPLPLARETNDYRSMTWAPLGRFAQNVANRDVAGLVMASSWDEVYACVRGLCLATSVRTTADLADVWRHMGYEEGEAPLRHSFDPQVGRGVVTL